MHSRAVAVALIPLALGSLAACGSSKSPAKSLASASPTNLGDAVRTAPVLTGYAKTNPTVIDQDARDALTSLKSVHVTGTIQQTNGTTAIDLGISTSGTCQGTVSLAGQRVAVIAVGGKSYLKANSAFWTAQANASAAAKVADKWVTGFPAGVFDGFCSLTSLARQANSDPISSDHPKVVSTGTVNGLSVVNLQVDSKDGANILSIATNSPHYLVKVVSTDGKKTEEFSGFDQPINAVAPAGAVDVKTLK